MRKYLLQDLIDEPVEKPEVVIWFFRWCWLALIVNLILCAWFFKDGYFPSESILEIYSDPTASFYVFNKTTGWVLLIFSGLYVAPLVLKSRPITYLIGWVIFALLLLNIPIGTFISIVFIKYWRKPETREYFVS